MTATSSRSASSELGAVRVAPQLDAPAALLRAQTPAAFQIRIAPQVPRRHVHQPLKGVRGFRPGIRTGFTPGRLERRAAACPILLSQVSRRRFSAQVRVPCLCSSRTTFGSRWCCASWSLPGDLEEEWMVSAGTSDQFAIPCRVSRQRSPCENDPPAVRRGGA